MLNDKDIWIFESLRDEIKSLILDLQNKGSS
jgi:hypothetical protein